MKQERPASPSGGWLSATADAAPLSNADPYADPETAPEDELRNPGSFPLRRLQNDPRINRAPEARFYP